MASTELMGKMKKSNLCLLLLLAFYGLFLILGAAIFSAIESPLEVVEIKNMRDRKSRFLRTHTCLTGNQYKQMAPTYQRGRRYVRLGYHLFYPFVCLKLDHQLPRAEYCLFELLHYF